MVRFQTTGLPYDFDPSFDNLKNYKMSRPKGIPAANKTHGMTHTPTYKSWISMRQRCNPKHSGKYGSYYDKGISVCDRWQKSFVNFLKDMGVRPSIEYTLNRIDNNGDYEPGNCVWSTWTEQNNNKSPKGPHGVKKSFGTHRI